MGEMSEEKAAGLLGKHGATALATLTSIFAIAWALYEGLQKLDAVFFRWIMCAIVIGVCVVYLKLRKFEKNTGILVEGGAITAKRVNKSEKYAAYTFISVNFLYLTWSILTYALEKPVEYQFDHPETGTTGFWPVAGANADYWDLQAYTHVYVDDDEHGFGHPTSTMTFRVRKVDSVKYVTVQKVVVSISKIEALPDLTHGVAPAGEAPVNLLYFYNLPSSVKPDSADINPAFYRYKGGVTKWDDNGIRLDDSFPLTIKLYFAAEKPGIYTIKDISVVVSRGIEPGKPYSMLTRSVPLRLAFADVKGDGPKGIPREKEMPKVFAKPKPKIE
jgi:hypothetical protein